MVFVCVVYFVWMDSFCMVYFIVRLVVFSVCVFMVILRFVFLGGVM